MKEVFGYWLINRLYNLTKLYQIESGTEAITEERRETILEIIRGVREAMMD